MPTASAFFDWVDAANVTVIVSPATSSADGAAHRNRADARPVPPEVASVYVLPLESAHELGEFVAEFVFTPAPTRIASPVAVPCPAYMPVVTVITTVADPAASASPPIRYAAAGRGDRARRRAGGRCGASHPHRAGERPGGY